MRTYSFRDLILTLDRWVIEKDLKEGTRIVTIDYLILALSRYFKIKDIMGGMRTYSFRDLILTLDRWVKFIRISHAG